MNTLHIKGSWHGIKKQNYANTEHDRLLCLEGNKDERPRRIQKMTGAKKQIQRFMASL